MLLKLGSSGEDVKKLQTKLNLKSDGQFGPGTEKAVKEWQSSVGLTPDGVIGDKSWEKLFDVQPTQTPVSSGELKLEKLRGVIPDSVISQIPETAEKFGIKTNLRLAHFLSQCAHESGTFKLVNENLNYSADGLKKIFGKYFPGDLSNSYARNPEKIASRVYASRMGNGDENSKEGWKFRGRGYIQLTGKSNYSNFSKFVGEDCVANPDLVATKYPLASAAFFFENNKLWSICDLGWSDDVVTRVTKRVNGGNHGLEDRLNKFKKYWSLLK